MLGCGLYFDEFSAAGDDQVHINIGAGIFFVAEVEHGYSVDDANAGGGDVIADGRGFEGSAFKHGRHGEAEGYKCAGDGSGAGATVGLNYVAIDEDSALAELFCISDGAERAA